MLHTRKPMTDEEVKAMQDRIDQRRAICRRVLGAKYIGHPVQRIKRKDAPLVDVGRNNLVLLRKQAG